MAELGIIDGAAEVWLQRLERDSRLPSKSRLEVLRKRELSSKDQALALADTARHAAALAEARLLEQKDLARSMEEALKLAKLDLIEERRHRKEAEHRLDELSNNLRLERRARENEVSQRLAAEVLATGAEEEVKELKALLADDESLLVMDEMCGKLEAKRMQISTLESQLEACKQGSESLKTQLFEAKIAISGLEKTLKSSDLHVQELEKRLREKDKEAKSAHKLVEALRAEVNSQNREIEQLKEAGAALQESAGAVLAACQSHREAAAKDRAEEAHRQTQRREVGVNTDPMVVLEPTHPMFFQGMAAAAAMPPTPQQQAQAQVQAQGIPPTSSLRTFPVDSGEQFGQAREEQTSQMSQPLDLLGDAAEELIRAIENISNATSFGPAAANFCMPNQFAST